MKVTITLSIILICFSSISQEIIIDSCGIDNSPILNQYEINYFNQALPRYHLDVTDQDLNLDDMRILFKSSDSYPSKIEFFELYGKPWYEKEEFPSVQLITLTEEEKKQLPNYDAIIVSWSKTSIQDKKVRRRIINEAIEELQSRP